jgi:SPRY domain
MVAIILLLTTISIAAFKFGRISSTIRHRVTHSSIRRFTMESSTPNKETESEIAKQALSDRSKSLSCSYHPVIAVIDNGTSIKVSADGGDNTATYRGLIWDKSIHKYSVKIDESSEMSIMIGFGPSKSFNVYSVLSYCGWYLALDNGCLYSLKGDYRREYSSRCEVGDTITCIYNSSSSEISFEKNGVSLGVAFTNVKGEDIAPALVLMYEGARLTLSAISKE